MSVPRKLLVVGAVIAITMQQPTPKTIASNAVSMAVRSSGAKVVTDDLIARAVGHAEGTRTADGRKTRAYYGHSDPGNGVWNLGSFSYQHGAKTPEEADLKQLQRLKAQGETILTKARNLKLKLSLEETLNAIDLANQAPLAALDAGGFVERLAEAKKRGLKDASAILWARTQSYRNSHTGAWEAPGLGNTEAGVGHDQDRRMTAIQRAIESYRQQKGEKPVSFDQGALEMELIRDLVRQGVE